MGGFFELVYKFIDLVETFVYFFETTSSSDHDLPRYEDEKGYFWVL